MRFFDQYPIRKRFKSPPVQKNVNEPPPPPLERRFLPTSQGIITKSLTLDIPTLVASLTSDQRFQLKRALASPSRYYGDGGTIHSGGKVDVETRDGKVVSVWFRCQMLPFEQHEVDRIRAEHMDAAVAYACTTTITGVEVRDS